MSRASGGAPGPTPAARITTRPTWEGSEAVGKALRSAVRQADERDLPLAPGRDAPEQGRLRGDDRPGPQARRDSDPSLKLGRDRPDDQPRPSSRSTGSSSSKRSPPPRPPTPPTRAKAIRGLLRHQGQQEARESALRGLASVAESGRPGTRPPRRLARLHQGGPPRPRRRPRSSSLAGRARRRQGRPRLSPS